MLFVRTAVQQSKIAGEGLFLTEPVRKGRIVSIHAANAEILTQSEYQREQGSGSELVLRSGIRWVGQYFLCAQAMPTESYMNHSDDPSLLYHCGISFARRDLGPGDELTIDYTLFLAEDDITGFVDVTTGRALNGRPPREALIASAKQLVELLEGVDEMPV
jgi:hypothetical protein